MKSFIKFLFKISTIIFSTLINIMIALAASYILFLLFGNTLFIQIINLIILISAIIYSIQEVYESFYKK
jgi:hypothetical protein